MDERTPRPLVREGSIAPAARNLERDDRHPKRVGRDLIWQLLAAV